MPAGRRPAPRGETTAEPTPWADRAPAERVIKAQRTPSTGARRRRANRSVPPIRARRVSTTAAGLAGGEISRPGQRLDASRKPRGRHVERQAGEERVARKRRVRFRDEAPVAERRGGLRRAVESDVRVGYAQGVIGAPG